jgi:choline monooxygenase
MYFGKMMDRLKGFPFDKIQYHPELSREFKFTANWALYCENYLEGFHIPFVHAGLNALLDFGNYHTELFPYANLQVGIAKPGEMCFDLAEDSKDYGQNIAAYYFWVFPNMMFNVYPWGLSLNIVEPISVAESKVKFHTFIWNEDKYNQGAGSNLDIVEFEDEEIVINVQKGIRSRFYKNGRYSVTREQGTHHFHGLIADALN